MINMRRRFAFPLASCSVYIFWIILLVGDGLGLSNADRTFQIMAAVSAVFALIKMLVTRWTASELIICILLNILGILVLIFSGTATIALTLLAITSSKDIDIYKVLKLGFWVKAIMFIAVTSLAISGVTDMQFAPRYFSEGVYTVRYALGYGHPNAAQYTLFTTITLALMCYHKRMRIFHYVAALVYSLFIFSYTDSRTGIAMTVLLLALAFVADRSGGVLLRSFVSNFGQYSYIVGAVTAFLLCFMLPKFAFLDSYGTLRSRFVFASKIISGFSLSLFGDSHAVTDIGYVGILYKFGVIVFGLFMLSLTKLTKLFTDYRMYIEAIILIVYAIYSLSESYTASVLVNAMLLFVSWIIYPKSYTVNIVHKPI